MAMTLLPPPRADGRSEARLMKALGALRRMGVEERHAAEGAVARLLAASGMRMAEALAARERMDSGEEYALWAERRASGAVALPWPEGEMRRLWGWNWFLGADGVWYAGHATRRDSYAAGKRRRGRDVRPAELDAEGRAVRAAE